LQWRNTIFTIRKELQWRNTFFTIRRVVIYGKILSPTSIQTSDLPIAILYSKSFKKITYIQIYEVKYKNNNKCRFNIFYFIEIVNLCANKKIKESLKTIFWMDGIGARAKKGALGREGNWQEEQKRVGSFV
jgi:hypothetical protein